VHKPNAEGQGAASTGAGRLKVLYHHRIAASDGMRVHVEELVGAFRELGHEVLVVGPGAPEGKVAGGEPGRLEKLVDLARKLLPGAVAEALELGYNAIAYRRLSQAVRSFKPDVIYERYNLYLLAGRAVAKKTKLPLILEINSPLAEEREKFGKLRLKRIAHRCEQMLWETATFALPVTEVLAKKVRDKRGRAEGVQVFHNGARLDAGDTADKGASMRAKLGLAPDDLVLGFVGFIRDWHGVGWAMDVLPQLGPKAHLVVVGDGPVLDDLRRQAAESGIAAQTHFIGAVPHHEVAGYVATFDIALQIASVAYASPLKIFDYMTLGRAIVAPDQPNIREILTDGSDALLFKAGDAEAFKSALLRLCQDDALRSAIGRGARETLVRRRFTWRDNAERIAALHAPADGAKSEHFG
jgi:glycosyltransferase involved in cell wall biosynthesis